MQINLNHLLRPVVYTSTFYIVGNVFAQEQTNTADMINLIRNNQGLFEKVSGVGVYDPEEGLHYRRQVLAKAYISGDQMYILTYELPQEIQTKTSVKTIGGNLELIVISNGNSSYPMSNVTLTDPDGDGFPEVGPDDNSQKANPRSREEYYALIAEYRRILHSFRIEIDRLLKAIKQRNQ